MDKPACPYPINVIDTQKPPRHRYPRTIELFASFGSELKVKLPVDSIGSLAIDHQSFVFQHAME